MVYEVRCILPHDRLMGIVDKLVVSATGRNSSMDKEQMINETTIDVQSADCVCKSVTFDTVGEQFSFEYTKRLIFLHEKDFRDSLFLVDSDIEASEENRRYFEEDEKLKYKLEAGLCHPHICILYVNEHVGHGLFATETIAIGTFIGEYVGLVKRVSPNETKGTPASAYSASYGTDGSTEINAYEYGNIIRFINHSDTPNCSFRNVIIDDMQHILVMTEIEVLSGQQLFVSYGGSYWHAHATPSIDINSAIRSGTS